MPSAAPLPRSPSILTLYSAEDLLVAPGCPVCHYAAEASDRYLTWMALEGHAQTDTITRLCAGLGACAAHTRRLAAQPGAAIRLTAVYRYIVTAARDQLAGRAARPMACMACEHDAAAAGRAVETLLEGLQDNVVRDKYRDLGSLCLPHLDAAAVIARHRDVSWLTGRMQETITGGAAPGWLIGIDRDAEDRAVLRRALPATGIMLPSSCPPCLAGAQAERDALGRLRGLAGDISGPAGILCAGHLSDEAATASPSALHALLAWQAQCMASLLPAWPAHRIRRLWRREDPAGQCVVCQARVAAERRTLSALHGGPQAPPAASRQCVRHLLRPVGQRAGHALTQDAVARAGRLIGELADASGRLASPRSRDAPFRETRAWRRAAAFIDGAVFGGAPPRDP